MNRLLLVSLLLLLVWQRELLAQNIIIPPNNDGCKTIVTVDGVEKELSLDREEFKTPTPRWAAAAIVWVRSD